MMLLVSGATATVRKWSNHPNLGVLLTPRAMQSLDWIAESGMIWACDNDCFNGLDPDRFCSMVDRVFPRPHRCAFVTIPDEVANHDATLELWELWYPYVAEVGLPAAFVLQDGAAIETIPWGQIRALFIGGSTEYKESLEARAICLEARHRGIWVHVGRVNTQRRERRFIGVADSIDGTAYSMFPDRYIPPALKRLSGYDHQVSMGL